MASKSEIKYPFLYDFLFDGILKTIRLQNLKLIKKYNCKNIIDLGCGTGSQCKIISNNVKQIIGLDNSKKMIEIAKIKKIKNTKFILGDITKNNFPDKNFDCIIISLVLHSNNKKTIKNILNESRRINKKNGIIIITDYDIGFHFKGAIANFLIFLIESFAGKSHRKNYYKFMKRGAIEKILKQEGYDILESFLFYFGALKICIVK
jgi:ubiquinone/menaquinone biosynthesis C-methylase UbiE